MKVEKLSPQAVQRIHDLDQLAAKIESRSNTATDVIELKKKYEKLEQAHKFLLQNEKESLIKTGKFPIEGV